MSLIEILIILSVLCAGYLAWHFQDVLFYGKFYKDFFRDRKIRIAIILLIVFITIICFLIDNEAKAYGPEQFLKSSAGISR